VRAVRRPAQFAEFFSLVRSGKHAQALRLADEIAPTMIAVPPRVNGDEQICTAPELALVLARLGEPAQAKHLADAALAAWERAPGLRMPQHTLAGRACSPPPGVATKPRPSSNAPWTWASGVYRMGLRRH
jgi:hypothetical protein